MSTATHIITFSFVSYTIGLNNERKSIMH